MNLKEQEKHFENHVAKFFDYGDIKVLDFAEPGTSHYHIRFVFDESLYKLYISGDLGELVATNYYNMTYDKFGQFVNDIGYFKQKIDCMSRALYFYDRKEAEKDIKNLIVENDIEEQLLTVFYEDDIDAVISELLEDFDSNHGISGKAYDILDGLISDLFEEAPYIGRIDTGIIDLYMLAFKLAQKQLKGENHEED